MARQPRTFSVATRNTAAFSGGDILSLAVVLTLLYLGARLAFSAPEVVPGRDLSLDPRMLPRYALFSVGRMSAAYLLSLVFSLVYGRLAASHPRAEQVLISLLDVLQSVPILSFLPVVLLGLSAFLSVNLAAELSSIILIFTSQVWNLTFAWYQSLTTIPKEYREASAVFRLNDWMKFKTLELPFGMISLVWNSMMSWAGGWFFLMAAEIFTVGSRDFRLPGLGAYLHEAANQGDSLAILYGLAMLIGVVVLLDQLVWRPLIAWSERFKVEMVESGQPPTSWFYNFIRRSGWIRKVYQTVVRPIFTLLDQIMMRQPVPTGSMDEEKKLPRYWTWVGGLAGIGLLYGLYRAGIMLSGVPVTQWVQIGQGMVFTFLRVLAALILAMVWTIPLGVLIGTNPRLSAVLQPLVQVAASVPATALFPVVLLVVLNTFGGMNVAAVLLMLMGTQWYLLFNIIAGASSIPQDLVYTSRLLQLNLRQRWTTLILPAIFPYLVTGMITASGGAWNASIVAEYQITGGQVHSVMGIGSIIAHATAAGDYALLLAATGVLIGVVVLLNRLVWRRLYRLAEVKYRME